VDRFYLLAPALTLLGTMSVALMIFAILHAIGRAPDIRGAKHNQLLGPFFARYLVWLIGPIERLLLGRVSPNVITAASLLLCGVTGFAAGLGHLGGAVWLYAFAGILDVLDGRIARLSNKQTRAGALFDSVSDRWGELFVFSGYAWYLRDSVWLLAVMGAIGASLMVSYTRARAEGLGIELSGGLMQRAERVLLAASGTLLAAWYGADAESAWLVAPILGGTMLLIAVASGATAVNRWIVAFRELARRDAQPPVLTPSRATPALAQVALSPIPPKLRESAELAPAAPRL
jgi:CDP-diacylglycerol---glycerol-3-phosphate 3-phosphatidyltransferase